MPNHARPEDFRQLEDVVTLAEAARRVGRTYTAVLYARDAGNIPAIRVGRVWITSLAACHRWFDRPRKT